MFFTKIFGLLQSQLSHGASFPYSAAPGSGRPDYSVTAPQRPHDDPLSLHQALGQAVEEAQAGLDDNTGFISDLPLLKGKFLISIFCYNYILTAGVIFVFVLFIRI